MDVLQTKNRIEYLDAMRGFCMILVVYAHLGLSAHVTNLFCNNVFQTFRMPLFFFLSGFLCFSKSVPPYCVNKIRKRFLGQLLPTFVVGVLFVALMVGGNFEEALLHKSKAGYWFTFVALEMYFIYALITFVMDKISSSLCLKAMAYFVLAILFLPLSYWIGRTGISNTSAAGLFSLVNVVSYTPFFLFGVIAKMYNDIFKKLVESKWVISAVIVVFVALHIVGNVCEIDIKLIFYGLPGVVLIYIVFHNFRDFFCNKTWVGRALSYIGKRTLPIYLIHYFLLSGVAPEIIVPVIQNNCGWIVGFMCFFILSLVILGTCLLIEALFRKAEPLYRLCFGYPN